MPKQRKDKSFPHTCPYCEYDWSARKENPKRCPLCVRWLPPWVPAPDKTEA